MAMPALDTHKAVKTLRSAGFDDAQAEAVVEQINDAVNENVATKVDIERLSSGVAADIEKLSSTVAADMEKLSGTVAADIEKLSSAVAADVEKLSNAVAGVAANVEKLSNDVAADIERLSSDVAGVAADNEKLSTKLDNAVENMELRLQRELEKQANRYLRYVFVAVATVAGLTKALDVLIV